MKNNLLTGFFIGLGIIVIPLILMGSIDSKDNNKGQYEFMVIELWEPSSNNEWKGNRLYRLNTMSGGVEFYERSINKWISYNKDVHHEYRSQFGNY